MNQSFSPTPLRELLSRSSQTLEIDPLVKYQEVTVKMWGKGVVRRGYVDGSALSNGRRFLASAGQFVLSRIDARHGANGLIPNELDSAIVTNDFPLFDLDSSRLEPKYLEWLGRTHDFVDLCLRASEGTTNRVRLSEERFLSLSIPLPSLDEQRRIVGRIDVLAAKIGVSRTLRDRAVEELAAFWPALLNDALRGRVVSRRTSDGSAQSILVLLAKRHEGFVESKANNGVSSQA